ncbi:MAG: beta strand repeat-containing protein [Bacteroidales bacterium]
MRKLYTLLFAILVALCSYAQAPNQFSYQAIVRNANSELIANQPIGMQISILQESINGSAIYVETQNPTTNTNGMISIEIGNGTIVLGTFSSIDWANGPYFIKTEIDPTGGTNYSITGTSQLLSVPYALHAKTAESISGGITETDPVFTASPANGITSANINNWNSAFGWGNHASAGYLTSYTETDPIFVASAANGITSSNISNWNTAYSWGNHASAGYLTSYTETDPIFVASVANGITSSYISNWNTAYSWGNHASAGYLTSYTETDPIFNNMFSISSPTNDQMLRYNSTSEKWENYTPTGSSSFTETDPVFAASSAYGINSTNISNWNTAYGWGNHATAGYLTNYTETDPIFAASAAYGISSTNISNWDAAYSWGNHATAGYLTSYTETDPEWTTASANYYTKTNMQTSGSAQLHFGNLTSTPTTLSGYGITDAMSTSHVANSITSTYISNWNTAYGWGNHATAGYLTSYTETDPEWTTASANYYTKTNMQTSGSAQLHFGNLTSTPTTLSGYGITDAMSTSHAANSITSTNISNWNTAYGWGNHATAGYLVASQTGNSGKFLTTDGSSASWASITKTTVGLGNVENTALSTWTGSSAITTLGTISTGTWNGTAIGSSYIGSLDAAKITSGTFDNARINWAAPGAIGSTTAAAGSFTSLSASSGLTVSAGTVTIKPSGSGGTSGQVLTTDGNGVATWATAASSSSISVKTVNANYTILTSDGFIITDGGYTFTLPSASSAGAGKMFYLYARVSAITITPASGDTFWDSDGNSTTASDTEYSGTIISDGVSNWYQVAK